MLLHLMPLPRPLSKYPSTQLGYCKSPFDYKMQTLSLVTPPLCMVGWFGKTEIYVLANQPTCLVRQNRRNIYSISCRMGLVLRSHSSAVNSISSTNPGTEFELAALRQIQIWQTGEDSTSPKKAEPSRPICNYVG